MCVWGGRRILQWPEANRLSLSLLICFPNYLIIAGARGFVPSAKFRSDRSRAQPPNPAFAGGKVSLLPSLNKTVFC